MKHIITAFTLMSLTHPVYADGIKDAAVLAVDKTLCGLTVPQPYIDASIVQGMRENNLTYEQAIYAAAVIGTELENYARSTGKTMPYCAARLGVR